MMVVSSCKNQGIDRDAIDVIVVDNDSINDIVPITSKMVDPIIYHNLIIDKSSTIEERKLQFINQVLPAILVAKHEAVREMNYIENLIVEIEVDNDSSNIAILDSLIDKYNATSPKNLLKRMKPHATSLVLAQAALESGWGTSRFAQEGNNLFGVRTSESDENSMPSIANPSVYVKCYSSVLESIEHYFLTIGSHGAYDGFRDVRDEEDVTVLELIDELGSYSERSGTYGNALKQLIRKNNMEQYDDYVLKENSLTISEKMLEHLKSITLKKEIL